MLAGRRFIIAGRRTLASSTWHSEIKHPKLKAWIEDQVRLCQPDHVHICTGSEQESTTILTALVQQNVLTPLKNRPGSYACRTDPKDVARSEQATFICCDRQQDAGPTNNWVSPADMKARMRPLFQASMQGRTMYVIPFSMGPLGSALSITGVQVTDSPYVVASMRIMTRMGTSVLDQLGSQGRFIPCLHSVGMPLKKGQKDVAWPCNIENRAIAHFPETKEIWSFGSGYGGNSLLGKKALALRIASVLGREEGWLAEHMLILGITNPQGKKYYVAAAFPSACGKTNLAMMQPTLPGWKVECVGDDICWMRFGKDGRLYAINPENGFFGVAPGTSASSNPNALKTIERNTLFTNVALTPDGSDVWWEGLTKQAPAKLIDWQGKPWTSSDKRPAAHPNSRFTVPIAQCPIVDPVYDDPKGVPISAILFGGRRKSLVPLVYESLNWRHGTLIGSAVASEMTAAAEGGKGQLRFDPFAMLPFCGYNMGDYFQHWLKMGDSSPAPNGQKKQLPKIFHVNWFRQQDGKFLWPGFGENSRVLKWIIERVEGRRDAEKTPIGFVPKPTDLDTTGLPQADVKNLGALLRVDKEGFLDEATKIRTYHEQFGSTFPKELTQELDDLEKRLRK